MKAIVGLLCVLLAGCAVPELSSSSPSPTTSVVFVCAPELPCSDFSEARVLTAVAGLGYPVKTITIELLARSCPVPPAPPCLHPYGARVSFVGTDKVAELELGDTPEGSGPYVVLGFDVEPADSSAP